MRLWPWSLFTFLMLPGFAAAETIDLVCVHREFGIKLHFKIDTSLNTVLHEGVFARDVNIDGTTISFVLDLRGGEYFHYISRRSGNMTVNAPHGIVIHGHECRAVKAAREAGAAARDWDAPPA